jgi:ferritin-like metal-binding protein YciE
MGLFSSNPNFDSMEDLLVDQLQDLYDAEKQLVKALPKAAKAASNPELKSAIEHHLEETKDQVSRLEEVFDHIGKKAKKKTCEAMKGLLEEAEEVLGAKGDPDVKDAAIIASAQRIEHYEIASYGSARTFAQHLGHTQAARLLQKTLDEEGAADKKLTKIAESRVNIRATV